MVLAGLYFNYQFKKENYDLNVDCTVYKSSEVNSEKHILHAV